MQFNVQLLDNQEYKISFKVEETKQITEGKDENKKKDIE